MGNPERDSLGRDVAVFSLSIRHYRAKSVKIRLLSNTTIELGAIRRSNDQNYIVSGGSMSPHALHDLRRAGPHGRSIRKL
ncbi:Aspartate-semialdehyde dehydrogenase [Corchorus olitorius]|uniref:Aspartate-semialdehyde dehydrogenase n=1 Tax=Corchorus olitorius TaxID=93759 RepID=A0A1R3KFH8_9ROSI|nr:Aspartate-semialdehyde dehydrogenase [Corchorus olitorius]